MGAAYRCRKCAWRRATACRALDLKAAIGFAVVRGGGIVGKHEVQFVAENEIVQISHEAMDRGLFVRGALAAARWAADKPPGFYVMRDVLGF